VPAVLIRNDTFTDECSPAHLWRCASSSSSMSSNVLCCLCIPRTRQHTALRPSCCCRCRWWGIHFSTYSQSSHEPPLPGEHPLHSPRSFFHINAACKPFPQLRTSSLSFNCLRLCNRIVEHQFLPSNTIPVHRCCRLSHLIPLLSFFALH
jgi:hypothetical protein